MNPIRAVLGTPLLRRLGFHARRIRSQLDRHFMLSMAGVIGGFIILSAGIVTLLEEDKRSLAGMGKSIHWAVMTVIGSGNSDYVNTAGGYVVGWTLAAFGVLIVAGLTGAVVGFIIDVLIKEGQGMGAAGYRDHIVVCGWNATARDLIDELRGDEFTDKVVLICDADRSPAGDGVYFVRGDMTRADVLERAGIGEAASAIVFPADRSDEADMRSILTILAIESIAPDVRTVVEVNNPNHVEHFRRSNADEILVTSRLASRLLARTALYPGLSALVTDLVSGGAGSELYRVELPQDCIGLSIDELSTRLRGEHGATLLAITRDGRTMPNPSSDFRVQAGDDLVVVAESLGTLRPLAASPA